MARSVASSLRAHAADRMPIEELARRTGMTVRNLRAMHARSLLDPPELEGRKGFYTERHVARVMLVLKLQSRKFSLASIQSLLESWEAGSGLMEVMGLEDSLMTPAVPVSSAEADVEAVFPELLKNPRALAKAISQELVVAREGRFIAPSAELLDIVKKQVGAGYPLEVVLAEGDALLADVDRIAARFRHSFFEHVVDPHFEPGARGAGLSDVAAKVELLRPLSVRAVSILLARAIERGGGPSSAGPEAAELIRAEVKSPARRTAAKSAKRKR